MVALIRVVVGLLALFFAIGGFATWWGWLDTNTYIVVTGIIGSTASILGLVALASPRLTAKDVREVEAELIKDLSSTMASVKLYEERALAGRQEIDRLAQERAEIELLVRQAALKAFLEERLRHISAEIERRIEGDQTLSALLIEYDIAKKRVGEVTDKIEASQRADLVNEIILETNARIIFKAPQPIYITILGRRVDISPIATALGDVMSLYADAIRRLIR